METDTSLEVQFEIHGAVCHSCSARIHGTRIQEEELTPFATEHNGHENFAWICTISSPPEFAGPREFEMKFTLQTP